MHGMRRMRSTNLHTGECLSCAVLPIGRAYGIQTFCRACIICGDQSCLGRDGPFRPLRWTLDGRQPAHPIIWCPSGQQPPWPPLSYTRVNGLRDIIVYSTALLRLSIVKLLYFCIHASLELQNCTPCYP